MEITMSEQLNQLFLSCGLGFLLGFYYEFYRVPRLIMRSGAKTIFFQDVLFFLTSAVFTFLFSLSVMDGKLRFYLFLGEAIGFASYYFTIGRLVMRFAGIVVKTILHIWKIVWTIVFMPFRLLKRLLKGPYGKFIKITKKIIKKVESNFKKVLKHIQMILYNQIKVSDTTSGTTSRDLHREGKGNHEGRRKEKKEKKHLS